MGKSGAMQLQWKEKRKLWKCGGKSKKDEENEKNEGMEIIEVTTMSREKVNRRSKGGKGGNKIGRFRRCISKITSIKHGKTRYHKWTLTWHYQLTYSRTTKVLRFTQPSPSCQQEEQVCLD